MQAQKWDWWPLAIDESLVTGDTIMYHGQLSSLASSGDMAPFLLRTNQQGNISSKPYSVNASVGVSKMASNVSRWWDYSFGVQLTGRAANQPREYFTDLWLPTWDFTGYCEQLWAHARLWVVDVTAGVKPIQQGSQSKTMSMGALLFSNNAHAIPRVTIGIDDYIAFPGLYGYLEIKGGITHGWLGDDNRYVEKVQLHHKFIGLRLGGKLPVTLAYEMHHAAQWGGYKLPTGNGEKVDYGNRLLDWWNVFLFRSGGISLSDQLNAQGNHIGVQEVALKYQQNGWRVTAYWQSIFEDMSARFIGFGTNTRDGLWGVNVRQDRWPFINEWTYELLNTTHQSGPLHDKDGLVFAGGDSYYTNSAYPAGWTYYGQIIGNPYLQTNNNRVRAHFVGISGDIYGYKYRILASHVDNYGRYKEPSQSTNTALAIEVNHRFKKLWGLEIGVSLAGDIGTQYGNQIGGSIRIAKTGILCTY